MRRGSLARPMGGQRPALILRAVRSGLLIAGLVLCGCGKPPQKEANRAPSVAESSPPSPVAIGNGPNCRLTFSATIADPDVSDVLVAKWFVDDRSQSAAPVAEEELPPNARTARWVQLVGSASSPLHAGGEHLVELVVSDGLLLGREPQPRQRLSDGAEIQTFAVTHAWTVQVEQGKDCP